MRVRLPPSAPMNQIECGYCGKKISPFEGLLFAVAAISSGQYKSYPFDYDCALADHHDDTVGKITRVGGHRTYFYKSGEVSYKIAKSQTRFGAEYCWLVTIDPYAEEAKPTPPSDVQSS